MKYYLILITLFIASCSLNTETSIDSQSIEIISARENINVNAVGIQITSNDTDKSHKESTQNLTAQDIMSINITYLNGKYPEVTFFLNPAGKQKLSKLSKKTRAKILINKEELGTYKITKESLVPSGDFSIYTQELTYSKIKKFTNTYENIKIN